MFILLSSRDEIRLLTRLLASHSLFKHGSKRNSAVKAAWTDISRRCGHCLDNLAVRGRDAAAPALLWGTDSASGNAEERPIRTHHVNNLPCLGQAVREAHKVISWIRAMGN